METIIEKLIELDFDGNAMQSSNIELNQANRNSVRFNYKIYKGSNEINYSDFNRAEVVFQKKDGRPVVDNAVLTPTGISYVLRDEIFDLPNIVTGQINLYTSDSLSATLLYNFRIVPDQTNISVVSRIYIGGLESLIAEVEYLMVQFKDKINNSNSETIILMNELQHRIDEAKAAIEQAKNNGITSINQTTNSGVTSINQIVNNGTIIINKAVDDFLTLLKDIEIKTNGEVDELLRTTSARAVELLAELQAEIERQHLAMEGILDNDFTTNILFNRHRRNEESSEQHLRLENDVYRFPNGKTAMVDATNKLPITINHNLNRYPHIQAIKVTNGFGRGGAGNVPAGGSNITQFCRVSYVDKNNLQLYTTEQILSPVITHIDKDRAIISGDDFAYHILFI